MPDTKFSHWSDLELLVLADSVYPEDRDLYSRELASRLEYRLNQIESIQRCLTLVERHL